MKQLTTEPVACHWLAVRGEELMSIAYFAHPPHPPCPLCCRPFRGPGMVWDHRRPARSLCAAAIGFLSLCAASRPAWAVVSGDTPGASVKEQQLKGLSLEQLGNVEVTSVSKAPEQVWKTPAAIFVITQEDIRRSGATNIPEVLRMAPGVEVSQVDADHWSIAIRGFAGQFSKSLLVLIDGRSVYTQLYSGVYWQLQNVLLEDVDRIEIIRGPGGTIWGSNAVNGVINIITKTAGNTQGALVTAGGGNSVQGTGAAQFGGAIGKNGSYRVYSLGFVRGPQDHSDGGHFDDWRLGQLGFRTDWKFGSRDTFTFQGDTYRGEIGERTFIATFIPPAEPILEDSAGVSGGNLLARWNHQVSDGNGFQFQAYFDRTNLQDVELGETRDTFDLDFIQHLRIHGHHQLTWGLGARFSPSLFIQSSPGVNFTPASQTDTIYSGFVQYELPLVRDKLALTAGTKLEHNNFSGFEYQPTARLLWTPSAHQSFWAAVTRAVRTPSRVDQDLTFDIFVTNQPPPVYFVIQGNRRFQSEKLLGYELGYRTTITRNLYLDVTGFYNVYHQLQNYAAPSAVVGTSPITYVAFLLPYANGIQGHSIGAEVAPDWKINSWWRLRGSYSFLHLSLRDAPGLTDVGNLLSSYLGSSPRHMASFQSLLNLPGHVELDFSYRFVSALPAQAVSAYQTADLRCGWRFGERIEFSVVGQNLFQPSHPEFAGDPGPLVALKRGAYAKLVWRH